MVNTAPSIRKHSGGFLSRLRKRFQSIPIVDPIDRRNATLLRVVLVFVGVTQPLSALAFLGGLSVSVTDPTAMALAATSTAIVWACFVILQLGHFRVATRMFVATSLILLAYGYWHWGFASQMRFQLGQVYPVLVGGLLLSRRALWLCTAAFLLVFFAGAWHDFANMYYEAVAFDRGASDLLHAAVALFVIALILDRAVTTLRDSLAIAVKRGSELARIRDRMQLEIEEKERSREQMLHAQKMQAVGRLASGIAHDFNHLLALILGYAQVNRDSKDVDQLRQAMSGIESAAKRANATVYKLLSFAREDLSRVEVFDAVEAIDDMRPVFAQLFGSSSRIAYELTHEELAISFDRAQFELMLLNIAANAHQAMPEDGRFRVTARALPESEQVEIELADNGHGMSEEVKQRIFEPFFTTKPAGQGTGLGLSTALDMVKSNGGTLCVDSAPYAGATFRIRLPRATPGAPPP